MNYARSIASARIGHANKPSTPFVGYSYRVAIGKHLEAKKNQNQLDMLSGKDESLGSAVRSGLKRIRSWHVPPNWSRGDWLEELAAVATAAAWQAVCDFDPKRGVPLAGFGYCRMISRSLARYCKEWRYALHIDANDCCEEETTPFNHPGSAASSPAKVNGSRWGENLHGAVGALPAEQRRLIEQLFWEERTEAEVADTMDIHQSTINRRKQAIVNRLRLKLRDRNEFQDFLHKDSVCCNQILGRLNQVLRR